MAGVFAGLSTAATGRATSNSSSNNDIGGGGNNTAWFAPSTLQQQQQQQQQPHPRVALFGNATSTFASAFGSSGSDSSSTARPAVFAALPASPASTATTTTTTGVVTSPFAVGALARTAPPPPPSPPFAMTTAPATTAAAPLTTHAVATAPFSSSSSSSLSSSVFGTGSAFTRPAPTTATIAPASSFAFAARSSSSAADVTTTTRGSSVAASWSPPFVRAQQPSERGSDAAVRKTRRDGNDDDGDDDGHDGSTQRARASRSAAVTRALGAVVTTTPAATHTDKPPALAAPMAATAVVPAHARTTRLCLLARVLESFYRKLGAASAAVREQASHELSLALCGVAGRVGVYADATRTAAELNAVWAAARSSSNNNNSSGNSLQRCRGEVWVVVFALGAQINLLVHAAQEHNRNNNGNNSNDSNATTSTSTYSDAQLIAYKAGVRAHRAAALADACALANELSTLMLDVYAHDDDTRAPYSALAPVLRCVRSAFDAAAAHTTRVQPNLKAVTSKLFSVLHKRVKAHVVPPDAASPHTWTLRMTRQTTTATATAAADGSDSVQATRALLCAFATLVSEMIRAEAASNDDVEHFIAAFHHSMPTAYAERCALYECRATVLLQQPLTMARVRLAAELFARALVTSRRAAAASLQTQRSDGAATEGGGSGSGNDVERARRRLLYMKLTATQLALGCIPRSGHNNDNSNSSDSNKDGDDATLLLPRELGDVVVALRAAHLPLFDAGMRHNATFFVQAGVYNVLQMARVRVSLLLVVKYYMAHACDSRLSVADLVAYHKLPYTTDEAALVWLLPLLVEKYINGVLDGGALVLSDANPFDDYPKAALCAAAAAAQQQER